MNEATLLLPNEERFFIKIKGPDTTLCLVMALLLSAENSRKNVCSDL